MLIKAFEGVRGLAALMVAFFHLGSGPASLPVFKDGYLFVDLFFVLSGFVISSAYAGSIQTGADFARFIVRRFGRLFPLLVFSTVVFVLVWDSFIFVKHLAVAKGYGGSMTAGCHMAYMVPSPWEIISTLTMTHGLGFFDHLILNYVSWSISTEFYAYVLFAAVFLFLAGRVRLVVFAALVVIGYAGAVYGSLTALQCLDKGSCYNVHASSAFARCICTFSMGVLLYHWNLRHTVNAAALQAVSVAGLAAVFFAVARYPAAAFLAPIFFGVLVLSLCRDTGPLAALFMTRPFQTLGERSYSIYMLHPILAIYLAPVELRVQGVVLSTVVALVYGGLVVFLSGYTYRWIEAPTRAYFNRLAARTWSTSSITQPAST